MNMKDSKYKGLIPFNPPKSQENTQTKHQTTKPSQIKK